MMFITNSLRHWGTIVAIAAAVMLTAGAAMQATVSPQPSSLDLLRRALDPNPTLQSYTASAQLSALLHVLLPVHETFNGTVYYLRPQRKIELQDVPGPLSGLKDLAMATPTYDEASTEYTITALADDGVLSKYLFIPNKPGSRVRSITISIDDSSALISHSEWSYNNGALLRFDHTYTNVGNFRLPAKSTIAARFPGYSIDGTLTFSDYQPNANVPPSIFATTAP
jgi:hypothetical protein